MKCSCAEEKWQRSLFPLEVVVCYFGVFSVNKKRDISGDEAEAATPFTASDSTMEAFVAAHFFLPLLCLTGFCLTSLASLSVYSI